MVWYPLGRPVGTTIYPGMQVTAVAIKNYILPDWSINDICVFIPTWFGVTATLAVAWWTYECTRGNQFGTILADIPGMNQLHAYVLKPIGQIGLVQAQQGGLISLRTSPLVPFTCAVAAAAIMSVVPAHLLRSIGGGYDNESIAMTAMVITFACWCASLRNTTNSWYTTSAGILTGVAYFYMVAAWGGYVFVLNVIGVHASSLVLLGRYSTKLHRAYTAFYIVGTALAIQVPVVGWTPLKSLEQLGPFVAFAAMQLIEYCEIMKRKRNLSTWQAWKLRFGVFAAAAVVGACAVYLLAPTGYFGPISSRVRGLFVKHTKTGNPLVDSVAEHQAASPQAYVQYLHELCFLAPIAFVVTALFYFNDSSSFLIVHGLAAYYFSHRMVRLILLTAPIASSLGGVFFGRVGAWMIEGALELYDIFMGDDSKRGVPERSNEEESSKKASGKVGKTSSKSSKEEKSEEKLTESRIHRLRTFILLGRLVASFIFVLRALPLMTKFRTTAHEVAQQISHPTIITKAKLQSGEVIMVDDYRDAYFWLRDNTPEDARIMAWWDCKSLTQTGSFHFCRLAHLTEFPTVQMVIK